MENILGLAISMIYILFILILGTAVAKYSKGASESSRKLVHILVGNWAFFAGSMTVFLVGVIVTAGTIIISELIQRLPLTPWYLILLIALLTGSIAVVLELSGKRGSDNLLLPLGTGLFATICYYYGDLGFYVYIL